MSELYNRNPALAQSLASAFTDSYNASHGSSYSKIEWDSVGWASAWDFRVFDGPKLAIMIQMVEAAPTHEGKLLAELNKFEQNKILSTSAHAVEGDEERIEAAVGRKAIQQNTGRPIQQPDIILLVFFRNLPYQDSSIPAMKQRLKDRGIDSQFQEIWIIKETGQADRLA